MFRLPGAVYDHSIGQSRHGSLAGQVETAVGGLFPDSARRVGIRQAMIIT